MSLSSCHVKTPRSFLPWKLPRKTNLWYQVRKLGGGIIKLGDWDWHIHTCCRSVAKSCPTLWDPVDCSTQASLSFTIFLSLFKLMSIELMMPSNHLTLCRPLLLLPSIFPSIRIFSNESVLHIRWAKDWSLSFSPSNVYSGLISFRIDWFHLLVVQGLSRVLSNTTVQKHQFFGVQFSL